MHSKSFSLLLTLAFAYGVRTHSLILSVNGANGVTGTGIGVVASTPRNGQDLRLETQIQGNSGCGRTVNGENDVAAFVTAAVSSGLAGAGADGSVSMTLHQVNGDGAGTYVCEVSADASGDSFVPITVTTDVPGNGGNSGASAQDFPLVAQIPIGTACTGGADGNACLVRCRQPQGFGGCVAVTATGGDGGAGAGNGDGDDGKNNAGNGGNDNNGNNGGNNNNGSTGENKDNGNGQNNSQSNNNRMMLVRSPSPIAAPAPAPVPAAAAKSYPINKALVARVKRSRISRGVEVA